MPKVKINRTKCINCGACIDICPMSVFGKDSSGKVTVINSSDCIACKACENQCPENAIIVVEE